MSDIAHGKRQMTRVVIALLLFAVIATLTRVFMSSNDQFPAGDSTWRITLSTGIMADDSGALLRITPPWDTKHARLFGQSLQHPGLRLRRTKDDQKSRNIVLIATRPDVLDVTAQFDVHISNVARPEPKRPSLKENNRSKWLASSEGIDIDSPFAASILEKLVTPDIETPVLVEKLFNYVGEKIRIKSKGSDDGAIALKVHMASPLGMTRAMVLLLRAAHLPARVVSGIDLSKLAEEQPKYWLEVYYQGQWHAMDVHEGYYNLLPMNFIPMRKGSSQVVEAENADITHVHWRLEQAPAPSGLLSDTNTGFISIFDLTRLSPQARGVLSLLLLLPLGVISTEILRQLVGIRTYGTFTPTLFALAMVYVDIKTAAMVLVLVTTLGVAGRAMMPDLNLSRVPRLSIVFTLVAMIMAIAVSLLIHFEPSTDSTVVLLPIVIMTMLIDRIYSVADECGVHIAMVRLLWTMAASVVALVFLLQAHWGEWLIAYPELHTITIAAIILLGSYKGKRLSSLPGLAWLREPRVEKRRAKKANEDQDEQTSGNKPVLPE